MSYELEALRKERAKCGDEAKAGTEPRPLQNHCEPPGAAGAWTAGAEVGWTVIFSDLVHMS
jgi:hypothetical protein